MNKVIEERTKRTEWYRDARFGMFIRQHRLVRSRQIRHVYSLGTLCNPCQRRMGAQHGADST